MSNVFFIEPSHLCYKVIFCILFSDFLTNRMKKVFAKENMDEVSEVMQPGPVIAKMWSDGVFSQSQFEIAYNLLTNTMKAKYLLDLMKTGPKYHEALIKALKETDQDKTGCKTVLNISLL